MQIVIDVPDEIYYKETLSETDIPRIIEAIRKGVNLPKGHGREPVIEKIKEAIRLGKYVSKDMPERELIYSNGWDDALEVALKIIDKYAGGIE